MDDNHPSDPYPGVPDNKHYEDGSWRHPFDSIQEAIDSASWTKPDLVLILDGTYTGPGNRNISIPGKPIEIVGSGGPGACIIDTEGDGRGFLIVSGETSPILRDLTIRNGSANGGSTNGGGGILVSYGSPYITQTDRFCPLFGSSILGTPFFPVIPSLLDRTTAPETPRFRMSEKRRNALLHKDLQRKIYENRSV